VLLGVGGPAPVSGLRGAGDEARHAVAAAAKRADRVAVVSGEEIGMHRLLVAGAPDELRSALRRRVLGALLDYDAEQHGDLVHTLRVFLECSASPARAAKVLHVHVNTLRYRITRASELLGIDLTDFTNQVDIYLALMIEG
jgi:DNA-binding PucR family transcriptional regulator